MTVDKEIESVLTFLMDLRNEWLLDTINEIFVKYFINLGRRNIFYRAFLYGIGNHA